jgi:hypothetical protein
MGRSAAYRQARKPFPLRDRCDRLDAVTSTRWLAFLHSSAGSVATLVPAPVTCSLPELVHREPPASMIIPAWGLSCHGPLSYSPASGSASGIARVPLWDDRIARPGRIGARAPAPAPAPAPMLALAPEHAQHSGQAAQPVHKQVDGTKISGQDQRHALGRGRSPSLGGGGAAR